jgi:hypothetical protein
MRVWLVVLVVLAVVDLLALVTLTTCVAVLNKNEQRAARARTVLRMLLAFLAGAVAVATQLHGLGILPP